MADLKADISGRFSLLTWSQLRPWVIYCLLLVLMGGELVFSLVFIPARLEKITTLVAAVAAGAQSRDKLSLALEVVSAMNWGTVSSDLARAEAAMPSEKKVSGLVSGLATLASSSGVLLTEVQFAPGKVATVSAAAGEKTLQGAEVALVAGVKGVPASLTLTADLPALIGFLQKVEKASQVLGVSSVQFGNFTGTGNIAQLTVLVYYQPALSGEFDWKAVAPLSAAEEKTLAGVSGQDVFILR